MKDEKMMPSKLVSANDINEDLSSGQLLRDIEEIGKALYLHNTPKKDLISPLCQKSKSLSIAPVSKPKSNVTLEKFLYKEKKPSIWNWKPLKALASIFSHQFNCCFFLHIHAIEGLPSSFNDLSLCVNWKIKDEVFRTCPARVCQGMAEFEETLMHSCLVNGNKNGPHNSAKYEPKHCLLSASIIGAQMLDIGKHWVDLTRLLPLTLEELEEEKRTSGKWTTSFKLTGKAKGATMDISFGFSLCGKSLEPHYFVKNPENLKGSRPTSLDNFRLADHGRIRTRSMLPRLDCRPRYSSTQSHVRTRSMDVRLIDEILPKKRSEFAHSISFLYRKLEEEKLGSLDESDFFTEHTELLKSKSEHLPRQTGEHKPEMSSKEETEVEEYANPSTDYSVVETIDIAEIFKDIATPGDLNTEFQSKLKIRDDNASRSHIEYSRHGENVICCDKSTAEEPESDFHHLTSGSAVLVSPPDTGVLASQESYVKRTSSSRKGMVRSLSLDDLTESVANDFLTMLGIQQCLQGETFDNGNEPPTEHLLQQFEEESSASESSDFDFKKTEREQIEFTDFAAANHEKTACSDYFDLLLAIQEAEQEMGTQFLGHKRNDKLLDNLETEALEKAWHLDEKNFHHSTSVSPGGFGSPIHVHREVPSCTTHLEKD